MKTIRVRYDGPAAVVEDARRFFRDDTITMASMRNNGGHVALVEKKRYGVMKEKFNDEGVRTKIILILLVRDTFNLPIWVQGTVIREDDVDDPIEHVFMGHETPMPDDPNEEPDTEI